MAEIPLITTDVELASVTPQINTETYPEDIDTYNEQQPDILQSIRDVSGEMNNMAEGMNSVADATNNVVDTTNYQKEWSAGFNGGAGYSSGMTVSHDNGTTTVKNIIYMSTIDNNTDEPPTEPTTTNWIKVGYKTADQIETNHDNNTLTGANAQEDINQLDDKLVGTEELTKKGSLTIGEELTIAGASYSGTTITLTVNNTFTDDNIGDNIYISGVTDSGGETVSGAFKIDSYTSTTVNYIVPTAPTGTLSISSSKLLHGALDDINDVGNVIARANLDVPSGYLECDGSTLSRTLYSKLFAVIGTTYGIGDGSTTFEIPDLRGEFIRGFDNGRGIDAGRLIGTSQDDQMQGHFHSARQYYSFYGSGVGAQETGYTPAANFAGNVSETIREATTDSTNGTPRTGSETRPKNIAMMYCIKY